MKIFIFFVALFCRALSQCPTSSHIPSGCNYNCSDSRLTCSGTFPATSSQLTITQCSDPLSLSLVVSTESPLTQEYLVGGADVISTCNNVGGLQITATYSRNTTHLTFMATGVYQVDIAVIIIPSVTLPLTPHLCMCQSMETVANNFQFQLPIQTLSYSCTRDEACSSVQCTFQDNSDQPIIFTFDPCAETILMSGANPTTGGSENALFNQTEDRNFVEGQYPFTVHMDLNNSNYSLYFSASVTSLTFGIQVTLFQPTQVLLDRSNCGNDLVYYPGSSTLVSICTTEGGTGGPGVTTLPDTHLTTPGGGTTLPDTHPTTPRVTTPPDLSSCPHIALPSVCQPLSNCSELKCSNHFANAVMVIDKCSDPLRVDLSISTSDSSNFLLRATYFVGGPEPTYHSEGDFSIYTNRNTTHLNISVTGIFEGDIAVVIIPNIEFPLDPHSCMCQSMDKVASNFKFSPALQQQLSVTCTTDQNCSSINCIFAQAADSPITFLFLPCQEAVAFTGSDNNVAEKDFFDRNETRSFSEGSINYTVDVVFVNHNYSMDFQMAFTVQKLYSFTPIPMTRISLDRSSCNPDNLTYYYEYRTAVTDQPSLPVTAIAVSDQPSLPVTAIAVSDQPSLPVTAIAVSVSLLLLGSVVVMVTAILCVGVYFKKRKQRAEVYSFSQLTDDDDDDESLA